MSKLPLQNMLADLHRNLDALAELAAREREERLRGLQLAARSLRQAESIAQWVQLLADAAAPLASEVAFFRVEGPTLRCQAARGMEVPPSEIALAGAPAFRQAVDTKETVVSLFAPSQLGTLGEPGSRRRAHLFPLVGKTRVLGVMLALDEAGLDVFGMEVLLSLGAASLELREASGAGLVTMGAVAAPAAPVATQTARAFARSTVARWVLDAGDAIAAGRARGDLYDGMRTMIDDARREYARRFATAPDYLHDEVVRVLAQGQLPLLGSTYPGRIGASDGN